MADYQKSPPSMLSMGPVTQCGCHDGCAVLKRCICRRKQQLCSPSCHRGRCCNSTIVDKSRTVTLDSSDEDTDEVNPITGKMWLPLMHLTLEDEQHLINSEWLNDQHISAAQELLKKQFPNVGGLLSPLIGTSTVGFAPADVGAVQIHNSDCLHWLTSTVGIFNPTCVEIFDSLSSGHLSLSLRSQLSDLYRLVADDDGKIRTIIKSVQQ
ncbi:uncharacterized protein LOC134190972 [Corticium candelabrum]|uniref:uncharacterized protein LOC134190972 n=1 Tax=Corticium candelabrum TaxID=121492 RepID=UPI002E26A782|nr:uncharacterized protein LOC134190972 [Corticium candelabrum]